MLIKPGDRIHFIKPEMIKVFKVREYEIAYLKKEETIRLIDIDGKPFIARNEIKNIMDIPSSIQISRFFNNTPRHYGTYYKDKDMYFPIHDEETIKSALLALSNANIWIVRDSIDERAMYLYKKLVEEIYPAFYADQKPVLTSFVEQTLGSIRAININGEAWFVGIDVATILGYKRPRDAIYNNVDDEDKIIVNGNEIQEWRNNRRRRITDNDNDAVYGIQKITFINISGLFSLILGSDLPQAKKFKHWVTSDLLPTLYRTGSYTLFKQINKGEEDA